MKTIIKISMFLLFFTLLQSCLPDSLDKWNEDSSKPVTVEIKVPPSNLSYPQATYVLTRDSEVTTISPTVTEDPSWPVTSWSISPDISGTGLTFNTTTGQITGAAADWFASTTYVVTAANAGGSTSFSINFGCMLPTPYDDATDTLDYVADPTQSIRLEKDAAITSMTPTCTTATCEYVIFDINPDISSSLGLSFDQATGTISGTPTTAYTSTLGRTVNITGTTITAQSDGTSDFRDEIYPGAKLIINSSACGADGKTICVVDTVAQNSFTLELVHPDAVADYSASAVQFGRVFTISATPATFTGYGDVLQSQLHIGVDPTNLSGISYGATNFSFYRDTPITTMTPVVLGDDLTFSLKDASDNDMTAAEFKEETGLDFSTTDGTISGTPRPKARQTLTVGDEGDLELNSTCTATIAAGFECNIPFATDSTTVETGNIILVYPVTNTIIVELINAKQIIRPDDNIYDLAGIGFNQKVLSTSEDTTVNGYLSNVLYKVSANNGIVSTDTNITIRVQNIAPTALGYPQSDYNLTNNEDITAINTAVINGDEFARTYSITPDISVVYPGLEFNTVTGEISGTPAITPAPATTSFTIDVDNMSSGTSTVLNIGVFDELTTLVYDQASTVKVRYVDADTGSGDGVPDSANLTSPGVYSVSSVDTSTKTMIISGLPGPGNWPPVIYPGLTIQDASSESFEVTSVTSLVSSGSDFTFTPRFDPMGDLANDVIYYDLQSGNDPDWDNSTGIITGTMDEAFGTQEFTIRASNAVGTSNQLSLTIAPLIVAPTELSYSNQILLKVGDSSLFESYQRITSDTGSGTGVIRAKNDSENLLIVDVQSGSFPNDDSLDNLVPFANELTTVTTNYGIINATLDVSDDSPFTVGGYVSLAGGTDRGLIAYIDAANDKLYVRLTGTGDFTETGANALFNDVAGTSATAATLSGVESNALVLNLSAAPALGTYYHTTSGNKLIDYDLTTDGAGGGIALTHYQNSDDVYVRRISGNLDTTEASGASFVSGVNVDNANPFSIATHTIDSVSIDYSFYLYTREGVYIAPSSLGSTPTSYSIDTTLPSGLTFDTQTGVISGSPNNSWPKTSYTVTATNQEGSDTTTFSIQVFDRLQLTNHTTDAPSYILHRERQGHKGSPCQILAANLGADLTQFCYLDAGELDLHQQGLTLGANVGANVCNYVRFTPFYFNRSRFFRTPEITFRRYTTNSDTSAVPTGGTCTSCSGLSGGTDGSCPADAGAGDLSNYAWSIYQTTNAPGVNTSPQCIGGACDTGSYTLEEYECMLADPAVDGTCVCTQTNVITNPCGGNEISCKYGPGIGFEDVANRPDLGKTYTSWTGRSIESWTFTAPGLASPYENTNLSLANFTRSNDCKDIADDYIYYYDEWLSYSNQINHTSPFQKSSATNYGKVNPYYKLECLDHAQTVKGTILLAVREFDQDFDISDDIDKVNPADMDVPLVDDFYDWDSFQVQSSFQINALGVGSDFTANSTDVSANGAGDYVGLEFDTFTPDASAISLIPMIVEENAAAPNYIGCVDAPCTSIGSNGATTDFTLGSAASSTAANASIYWIEDLNTPYPWESGAFDNTGEHQGCGSGTIPIPHLTNGQHHRLPEDSL